MTVLDNLSTGSLSNLSSIADRITFYQGDIRDPERVATAAIGCEVIYHLAAVVSVPETVDNPVDSARVNELGTLIVLETARNNNIGRVILSGSSAVYGDDPRLPRHEEMRPKPLSPYAVQKLTGEFYTRL